MKKNHILIIVLAGILLLSFNVFTTVKFYSLRTKLDKQGIINGDHDYGVFNADGAEALAYLRNQELWRGVEVNSKRIHENSDRIKDVEDYLNIEKGYIKKEKK